MNYQNSNERKLLWKDEYSVNVKEIDDQHKQLFSIINTLIETIAATPKEEEIVAIINEIVSYKAAHFATEDKYFHEFNYEGTAEHEAAHERFNQKVTELQKTYAGNTLEFAFALIDFLEDWLLEHLMGMDQKYTKCFNEHGLY